MPEDRFRHRITCGWLRDCASEPTPNTMWPSLLWDEQMTKDQVRMLDAQKDTGVEINSVWGLFVGREWPSDLASCVDAKRAEQVRWFTDEAHKRGLKVVLGMGIYSWGFDRIIREHPEVTAPDNANFKEHVMCPFQPAAWEWQKRVLDYVMDPRWGLDGLSMQSADQGRCRCPRCAARSNAEHHADILMRSAEYVRKNRPQWVIGTACWGLRVDEPEELAHIVRMSGSFDYLLEVSELSARHGVRPELTKKLNCPFGSVGGAFVEPPQHYHRLRWFVPLGYGAAEAIAAVYRDGGRANEVYYRPLYNPVEEVSWRAGAYVLSEPTLTPRDAVKRAVGAVYGSTGQDLDVLTDWMIRGEKAYLSRSTFKIGDGPLSLEFLIWDKNPSAGSPPVYLRDRMTAEQRKDYAVELRQLQGELAAMKVPNETAKDLTLRSIDGALADLTALL